ncbi:hypothetical protein IAR55_002055 [Kwoniella newhampshirensis]|uniref:Uncharacterized protein n=1 Tax=Kwoniella newhampshirensis TaxID=1651941 RepID=A0AAW0Z0I3_9TREE
MFAPRSHHIPRTYSSIHPTTSKKNTNKENATGNGLPTKTPSRAGKAVLGGPSTSMKMGLGGMALGSKTEGRDRNVLSQSNREGGKGKGREGEDIEPKRLFANAPPKAGSSIPPSKSLSSMPHLPTRTPAPSKRLPSSQTLRTPAPSLILQQQPAPTPLPSATRTRRRSRQSLSSIALTPIKADLQEASFVTPAPVGWEEEVSLGSIDEIIEGQVLEGLREVVEEEEDGEVEYMPPPVEELPWTPAFDHPDLKAIFDTLTKLPPMWAPHEVTIREISELDVGDIPVDNIRLSGDDELEEAWLRPKPAPPKSSMAWGAMMRTASGPTKSAPNVAPRGQFALGRSILASRSGSAITSAHTRGPVNGIMRPITKPPAPVPRPPAVRPVHNITKSNMSIQRNASKVIQSPGRTASAAIQLKRLRQIDEADAKLFATWDDEAEVETFDLGLDMGVPELEA